VKTTDSKDGRPQFVIFALCLVVYLLVLPALPDGTADDLQFVASLAVAAIGIAALVLGVKARRQRS